MNDQSVRSTTKSAQSPSEGACRVTVALLHQDRAILPLLFAVLAIPAVLEAFLPKLSEGGYLALIALDRLLQVVVMFAVIRRVRRRLEQPHGKRAGSLLKAFLRTCLFGFALWGMCTLPLIIAMLSPQSSLMVPAIFLLVIGIVWSLRYYFYSLPAALLGASLKGSAAQAYCMSKKAPRAALGSIAGPLAIMLLLVALCSVPYPDGRSLLWSALSSACEGAFWLLATYTTLGFGLGLVDEHDWREAGLDPYRTERLDTLRVQGGGFLSKMIMPRAALQIFFVSVLVFLANLARDFQEPPAARVAVKSVAVDGEVLKVTLEVSDPEFRLRGFVPVAFSVATQTGSPISKELLSVSRDPSAQKMEAALPLNAEPVILYLQFRTAKTPEVLQGLDNMWLWYKFAPVAAILPTAPPESPQAQAMPTA